MSRIGIFFSKVASVVICKQQLNQLCHKTLFFSKKKIRLAFVDSFVRKVFYAGFFQELLLFCCYSVTARLQLEHEQFRHAINQGIGALLMLLPTSHQKSQTVSAVRRLQVSYEKIDCFIILFCYGNLVPKIFYVGKC